MRVGVEVVVVVLTVVVLVVVLGLGVVIVLPRQIQAALRSDLVYCWRDAGKEEFQARLVRGGVVVGVEVLMGMPAVMTVAVTPWEAVTKKEVRVEVTVGAVEVVMVRVVVGDLVYVLVEVRTFQVFVFLVTLWLSVSIWQ